MDQGNEVDETELKRRVNQLLGVDFYVFAEGTTWELQDLARILESLRKQKVWDVRNVLCMPYEILTEIMLSFSLDLKKDALLLRATYLDVKRRLETYAPSTECSPVSSPPPKLTQECQKSPVSKLVNR